MQEGDQIRVTIDYYNSNIIFINEDEENEADEEESKIY